MFMLNNLYLKFEGHPTQLAYASKMNAQAKDFYLALQSVVHPYHFHVVIMMKQIPNHSSLKSNFYHFSIVDSSGSPVALVLYNDTSSIAPTRIYETVAKLSNLSFFSYTKSDKTDFTDLASVLEHHS